MAWRKFPSFNLFFINFLCLSFSDVFRPFPAIFLPFPGYPFPLADIKKIYPTLLRSFGYIWWTGVDSDHRSQVTTDLQSVPFGRSGTCPYYGAGDWNRTHNLLITSQLLCQLSYTSKFLKKWCLRAESNHRQRDFQSLALPTELPRHFLFCP